MKVLGTIDPTLLQQPPQAQQQPQQVDQSGQLNPAQQDTTQAPGRVLGNILTDKLQDPNTSPDTKQALADSAVTHIQKQKSLWDNASDIFDRLTNAPITGTGVERDLVSGMRKGTLDIVKGMGDLGSNILDQTVGKIPGLGFWAKGGGDPAQQLQDTAEKQLKLKPGTLTTPEGITQNIGSIIAKSIPFFLGQPELDIPEGAGILQAASQVAKTGGEAALKGGGAQILTSGKIDKDVLWAAGLSAVAPMIGPLAKDMPIIKDAYTAVRKFMGESVPESFLKDILNPRSTEYSFGKNPPLAVAKEGIVANTKRGLSSAIIKAKNIAGQTLAGLAQKADAAGVTHDLTPVVKVFDDAIKEFTGKVGEDYTPLINRITKVRDTLANSIRPELKDLTKIPTTIATAVKQEIGNATSWTGQAFDGDMNQVRVKAYRAAKDIIDKDASPVVGESFKDASMRYANMLTAEKEMQRSANGAHPVLSFIRGAKMGGSALLGAGASMLHGGASGIATGGMALGGMLTDLALESPAVKTRVAAMLGKINPDELGVILKNFPSLKSIYLGATAKSPENK